MQKPINLVQYYLPSNHAIFHFQILAAMAANMVHGSAGYAAGFSAPTMAVIQKDLNLKDSTINWFGNKSILLLHILSKVVSI